MVHPNRDRGFRRSLRNRKGEITKMLEFEKDKPVVLNDREAQAVGDDIGCALVLVQITQNGVKIDWAETDAVMRAVIAGRKANAEKMGMPTDGSCLLPHHRELLAQDEREDFEEEKFDDEPTETETTKASE